MAIGWIAVVETAGRILPAMISATYQGFRTAPIPSGWVQTGERWALWGSTPISRTVLKELQPSDPAWRPFAVVGKRPMRRARLPSAIKAQA